MLCILLNIWQLLLLCIGFLFHMQYNKDDGIEHIYNIFAWELLGGCGLDVDLELVCMEQNCLKSVEELNHSPPMGIGSAYTSRPAKGDFAWTILMYFQITQPDSSIVTQLCTNKGGCILLYKWICCHNVNVV